MKVRFGASLAKGAAVAVLVSSTISMGAADAGAPPSVTLDGVAVCDFETTEQIITWTLTNRTTGGVEIQASGVIDGSALSAGESLETSAAFSPSIVLAGASADATSAASFDAVGLVSISVSAIQGDIDSFVTYTGSVTLVGCVEATTTTTTEAPAPTTTIAVEAPTTTAAVEPIALPSTGSGSGTAALAALFLGMGGALLLLVRRRSVRS